MCSETPESDTGNLSADQVPLKEARLVLLWRKKMDLRALYDDVQEELHTANEFLSSLEQTTQTKIANTLSQVAIMGVALGFAVGVLGMNVVFDDDALMPKHWSGQVAIIFGAVAISILLVSLGTAQLTGDWWNTLRKQRTRLQTLQIWGLGLSTLFTVIFTMWQCFTLAQGA
jgi:cation transport ATPase